jgi:hypothetical protein
MFETTILFHSRNVPFRANDIPKTRFWPKILRKTGVARDVTENGKTGIPRQFFFTLIVLQIEYNTKARHHGIFSTTYSVPLAIAHLFVAFCIFFLIVFPFPVTRFDQPGFLFKHFITILPKQRHHHHGSQHLVGHSPSFHHRDIFVHLMGLQN